MSKVQIIKDQEYFFNIDAEVQKEIKPGFFYDYAVKEAMAGFRWMNDKKPLLDYGCGVGLTLELYLNATGNYDNKVYGIDISEGAIKRIKEKFPGNNYEFFKIQNNKIPQVKNESIGSCYLIHILHHSKEHEMIFREVYEKLSKGGKFFICDMSSNNPLLRLGRKVFVKMPNFIKNRFTDDLVVEGAIPDKYPVNIRKVCEQLQQIGFKIEGIGYGHLFFFIFVWLDKFTHLYRFKFAQKIINMFSHLEDFLLKFKFFRRRAEVFYIKCVKQ